jgi:alkanesulfonate monooxygenase SsuD/methylene tetrahydromethanopterin reductase-like flavin-dependent oxidoreductase (luciferase family)
VLAGSTAVEAFPTIIELAQLADKAGFSRYWPPEVAVAAVASRTTLS